MAQGRGYGLVDEKGFVAAEQDFDAGAWKAVDTKRLEGDDGLLTRALDVLPVLGMCKVRARGAIRALAQALVGRSDAGEADVAWDKVQLRLEAQVALAETDDDAEVAAAAVRVRGALLVGQGTGQTLYSHDDEVRFGRMQVRLAGTAPLSDDVARCGLGPTLKRVATTTQELANATGHGEPAGRTQARSLQVRAALNGCITAFNGVHDDLEWLLAHTPPGEDHDTVEALLVPLRRMLDDRKGRDPAPPPVVAPPEGTDKAAPTHG